MKIVFFGTPQFAVPSLERLLEHPEWELIAVVTQPDKVRGRGKKTTPSPVKKVAIEHNIPVWQPKRIKKDGETLKFLKQADADFFAVVAYGQILSAEILNMPKLGCINVHGSILPQYRGAAPIQWSIVNGDRETGITTMLMDVGMDTGDMLLKEYISVNLLDNAALVAEKLANIGANLLVETLIKLENKEVQPIPQDSSVATYAPLIKKEDYQLDWSLPAKTIHDRVRGFYPNCLATFRGKPIKILATAPLEPEYRSQLPSKLQKKIEQELENLSSPTQKPGATVATIKNIGPVLQTGRGLLLLLQVQLAGKKPQSGGDFVNGMRLSVGETIE